MSVSTPVRRWVLVSVAVGCAALAVAAAWDRDRDRDEEVVAVSPSSTVTATTATTANPAPHPDSVVLTVEPPVLTEGATVTVTPSGLRADPTWTRLRRDHPDRARSYGAFGLRLCGPTGCDPFLDVSAPGADDADRPFSFTVHREIFGWKGWADCATVECTVIVSVSRVGRIDAEGALHGDTVDVASAPLRFDPAVVAAPRPRLSIDQPPPYRLGQVVTVRTVHLPAGARLGDDVLVAACSRREPDACAFSGAGPGRVTLEPGLCRADGCAVALLPAADGHGPLVTVPVDVG